MPDVKWIKIVTDIFDDEKVLLIESMPEADAIIVIWFKLLCLAGKQNNGGVFTLHGRIPYTDEMFATIMRRPLNTVRLALRTFEQYGMIEIVNNAVTIPNWEKHQSLGALEKARESTRKRVAEHREKQHQLVAPDRNAECNVTTPVTVTLRNGSREEKTREEKKRVEDIGAHARDDLDDDLIAYITTNLYTPTSGNWDALREIMADGMSADMVRVAVDAANAQNARTLSYVMTILNRWLVAGHRTPADIRAAEVKRQTAKDKPVAKQFQRMEDYADL